MSGFTLQEGMALSACVYWVGYFVGVWNERRLAARDAKKEGEK